MKDDRTTLTRRYFGKASLSAGAGFLLSRSTEAFPQEEQPVAKNVVLTHGAFADGSSWSKVIPLLEAKGLHVTAVHDRSCWSRLC